jgi:hypothetical protein
MKYYTYAYLREDRTPYYIGKGKGNRAFRKRKGSYPPPKNRILILKQNLTEDEAFKHEIYMIAVFGRKDLEVGILRNKTNGGEGSSGHSSPRKGKKLSEDHRHKLSEAAKKRVYDKEEWSKKISQSLKGNVPWNKGKTNCYSPEHIEKLKESGKISGKKGGRGNKKKSTQTI